MTQLSDKQPLTTERISILSSAGIQLLRQFDELGWEQASVKTREFMDIMRNHSEANSADFAEYDAHISTIETESASQTVTDV
ncbi:hypothetical protein GCM10010990_34940 [Croceicoccus mobilis]|uniref:Uncharacterized protein n=2 Tax=Croceicoccus mobilis TaxID=1703339 RepID=A0A917DZC0_9SPHN|nr:hypothetical protein GCM10010990_34940 [Croceicoccus mobilis]